MERLNYHHLLYFFTVAREGSVARASVRLGLKQPTVSAQIHALEQKLGRKLLERNGRGLNVTPAGEIVLRYAETIFAMGGELLTAIDGQEEELPKMAIGVSSSLPPPIVAPLLNAVFQINPRPVLSVEEGAIEALFAKLAGRSLQCLLTDVPPGKGPAKTFSSRVLLESALEVFAPQSIVRKVRKDLLAQTSVPVLLPTDGALRRGVESWLAHNDQPIEKLAEMPHPETCAAAADAAIFAPSLMAESLKKSHGLLPVRKMEGARWRVYLVTAGKSFQHPGLDALTRVSQELH